MSSSSSVDEIIAGTITAGTDQDFTGAVMRCVAVSDGVAGQDGTAGGAVVEADMLVSIAMSDVVLRFNEMAPGWVAALWGLAAAMPVAEPAWAGWAGAMEVVVAVEAVAIIIEASGARDYRALFFHDGNSLMTVKFLGGLSARFTRLADRRQRHQMSRVRFGCIEVFAS